jgi:hypothetical protein
VQAPPLLTILDRTIRALWPRRAQQELLLDLGERKSWDANDYQEALACACAWLGDELSLRADPQSAFTPAWRVDPASFRDLGARHGWTGGSSGVAKWAEAIAPAVGSSPKTLVNSLTRGLRSDRSDHRWLVSVAHAAGTSSSWSQIDAWLYHRRSAASVSSALSSLGANGQYSAGDATLVFSLLALWQRRRPTQAARSNKSQTRTRRETPKPVAALRSSLASPGQLPHLLRLARTLAAGRDLALLGVEAALTEAHLAPHAARRSSSRDTWDGETWLGAVEVAVADFRDLVSVDDAAVIGFRIERMRAWREARPLVSHRPPGSAPYVEASMALEATRAGAAPVATFSPHTPGVLMLLPLLRSRGLVAAP